MNLKPLNANEINGVDDPCRVATIVFKQYLILSFFVLRRKVIHKTSTKNTIYGFVNFVLTRYGAVLGAKTESIMLL